jgi:hypothetical protein
LITHFLGDEEVKAYCLDFAKRLVALKDEFPKKWFLLGQSGEKIAAVVFDFLPAEFRKLVTVTTVYVDRKTNRVRYKNSINEIRFGSAPILLIDSAIHSGQSMSEVVGSLWRAGAANILTYTLMLKRSSKIIPTYFGILVEDKDRVYFQLDAMLNNRLCEDPPFGILKEVTEEDREKKISKIGPPFEDLTISDLLYGKRTQNYHPYIYEYNGQLLALLISERRKVFSLWMHWLQREDLGKEVLAAR